MVANCTVIAADHPESAAGEKCSVGVCCSSEREGIAERWRVTEVEAGCEPLGQFSIDATDAADRIHG